MSNRRIVIDLDQVESWAQSVDFRAMTPQQVAQLLRVVNKLLSELYDGSDQFWTRAAIATVRAVLREWRRELKRKLKDSER